MKSKLIKNFNKDLLKSLKVLKINNENLYVTSNLTKIGKIRIAKQLKLKIILDALKKKLGTKYTIFTPGSTLNLVNTNIVFDPLNTEIYKMGPLSEFIRKEKSTRSLHPFWSIVGIGKKRKLLEKVSPHSYGYGSPWSKMLDNDFSQLNIGMHPSKAVTLIHHIETIIGVPYRFTKEFSHPIKLNNKIVKKNFYMSVFYKSISIQKKIKLNEHFFVKLKKMKKLNYVKTQSGLEMWSFKMRDFFQVATKFLMEDIYSYLEYKPNLDEVHKN
mgnify:CR=1 FL=1|jgi:aminoglycoside 3-N-acetyltransferase